MHTGIHVTIDAAMMVLVTLVVTTEVRYAGVNGNIKGLNMLNGRTR